MFNFVTDGYSYQLIMLVYKKYHGIGHTLHLIDAIAHPRVRGLTRLTKGGGRLPPILPSRPDLHPSHVVGWSFVSWSLVFLKVAPA